MLGYAATFRNVRHTEEWMAELREGEHTDETHMTYFKKDDIPHVYVADGAESRCDDTTGPTRPSATIP
jgi:hypothetical protein